jgi:anti-sigma factor RsiW
MSASCDWTRGRLARLLDGELPADERARAEAHLAGCAACRAARESLERVDATLRDAPAADDDARSFAALQAAIRRRYDLETAARLREDERAAGRTAPMTPEEVASAPLGRGVRRAPAARRSLAAPLWRWLAVGVPAAAAAVVAVVLLVREPEMQRAAREPFAPEVARRADETVPAITPPSPQAAQPVAERETPAKPAPPASDDLTRGAQPGAAAEKKSAAPPPAQPVAPAEAPVGGEARTLASIDMKARPEAPAGAYAESPPEARAAAPAGVGLDAASVAAEQAEPAPAAYPWPMVAAIAEPGRADADLADASARVALLRRAEAELQPPPRREAPPPEASGGAPLRTSLSASEKHAATPKTAPAASPTAWLAIADAWHDLMTRATAETPPLPECAGMSAQACCARQSLAAYRRALEAQDRAGGSADAASVEAAREDPRDFLARPALTVTEEARANERIRELRRALDRDGTR